MYLINTFMIFINIGLSFSQANVVHLAIATPGFLSRPKARSYDMFWINDLIRKSLQVYFVNLKLVDCVCTIIQIQITRLQTQSKVWDIYPWSSTHSISRKSRKLFKQSTMSGKLAMTFSDFLGFLDISDSCRVSLTLQGKFSLTFPDFVTDIHIQMKQFEVNLFSAGEIGDFHIYL